MRQIEPLRAVGALVLRDLGCALRTPTILLMAVVGIALCWVITPWIGGLASPDEEVRRFLLALDATVPALMGGSSVALFLLAEEREHGACAALARAGISLKALVAAKVLAALAFTAPIALVCLVVTEAPASCWVPGALAVTATSLPLLVISAGFGVIVRTYGQTSGPALILVCLALPTQVATLDAALAPLAALTPLEAGTAILSWLATSTAPAEGWAVVAGVFAAWLMASAAIMATCLRRRARQDDEDGPEAPGRALP